jgi:hypothetical protein
MVALFPTPGTVEVKIQQVHKESMKRVRILPYQCLDVEVYFAIRRMHVCRLVPKVGQQSHWQVWVVRALTSLVTLVYSDGHFAHD